MATVINIGTLLQKYANKQNSPFVNQKDFYPYVKKYAEHHIEEDTELVKYLGNPTAIVNQELDELAQEHLVHIFNKGSDKQTIIVIPFLSARYANRYKEISLNPSVPFPTVSDLPKELPNEAIPKENASEYILELSKHFDAKSLKLCVLQFPQNTPPILFPECVPTNYLIDAALTKIRTMLKKEEYYDYFLKKMRIANQGKEFTTKGFFEQFVIRSATPSQLIQHSSESFYLWNQLSMFIKKDFSKTKDSTVEDINILQSLAIIEINFIMLKNKVAYEKEKHEALQALEVELQKPPYFHSTNAILKFTDSTGARLYGKYNEEDLRAFLENMTARNDAHQLPQLLVVKIDSGTRYFIYKTKVFPLIIHLCNDAHDVIQKNLVMKWFHALQNYHKLSEMHNAQKFEEALKAQVQKTSPMLHTLLTASFLPVLANDVQAVAGNNFQLFSDGKLLPYSELLMIDQAHVLADAKMRLPFWYSIPIISHIIGFFIRKKKAEPKVQEEEKLEVPVVKKTLSKREALAQAAHELQEHYVPEGSTIDRELDSYANQWNKLISKEAHATLTQDVNLLIRDYIRKVLNTLSAQTFTRERIESLANSLVKTPNMQKITDQDSLYMYVQLYILRLVSNG